MPRGKQGGFRARNAELSRRLIRLETLVGKLGVVGSLADSDPEASGDDGLEKRQTDSLQTISKGQTSSTPRASEAILTSNGTRYLSGEFWSSLTEEVDGLKQLMTEPSDDDDDETGHSPASTVTRKPTSDYGPTPFIFSSNKEIRQLRKLHPPSPQMAILFDTYFHRCDPLFKILHKPTMAKVFERAENDLSAIERAGDEAIMFVMYYAGISSMSEEECMKYFREDQDELLRRYKYGTEIALVNANFLNSMELEPLQAFSLYLVSKVSFSISRKFLVG